MIEVVGCLDPGVSPGDVFDVGQGVRTLVVVGILEGIERDSLILKNIEDVLQDHPM